MTKKMLYKIYDNQNHMCSYISIYLSPCGDINIPFIYEKHR